MGDPVTPVPAAAAGPLRKAFRMRLQPGSEGEYRRRHNPVWDELATALKDHGVSNYSIFLDERTGDLFAYAESASEAQWAAIANTPVCRRWWASMAPLMDTNPDNSPAARDLHEVFHLD
jgi:L-rhamnose mutarotase